MSLTPKEQYYDEPCTDGIGCCGWCYPFEERPAVTDPPISYSVGSFLVRFPEFKPFLDDPSLGEFFLEEELNSVIREIDLGKWDHSIKEDSVYYLLAHYLQLRVEQHARTVAITVNAANVEASDKSVLNPKDVKLSDLNSTIYGLRLFSIRQQSQPTGNIIV